MACSVFNCSWRMEGFGLRISPEQAEDSRISMSSITKGHDTVPLPGHCLAWTFARLGKLGGAGQFSGV